MASHPFSRDDEPSMPISDPASLSLQHRPLRSLMGWFISTDILNDDPDRSRRGYFLVITTLVFIPFALLFVIQGVWLTSKVDPSWIILLLCCAASAINLLIFRYTGSTRLAGWLLIGEMFISMALISFMGNAILDSAFLINLILPWLASAIIGPRASMVVGIAIIAEAFLGFRVLDTNPRWANLFSSQISAWFWTLGYTLVAAAMAVLAWVYEGLTFRQLNQKTRELELAHRELARGEARFRSLVQKSSDMITLLDHRGVIIYQSPSSARTTGFSQLDLIGHNLFEYVHPEDAERVRAAFDMLREQGDSPSEASIEPYRFRTASGDWIWLESSATNQLNDPNVDAIVVHTHDFTPHRLVQEELMRAKQEAERLVHTRTTFLASLSHEVRTPLTSIIGFSNVLAGEVTGTAHEFATLIAKAGARLLATLNSILDFARLEATSIEPSWAYVDLVTETREALVLLKPLATEKGLKLDLHAASDPLHAWVDVTFYHRILNNLIGNAIKFTDRGGVTVRLSVDEPNVRIDIEDTGPGISETFLPRLFEEFTRHRKPGEMPKEGTGLGLPITKRLVSLMGGEISVESKPGTGSTFTVVFPLEPAGGALYDPEELEAL